MSTRRYARIGPPSTGAPKRSSAGWPSGRLQACSSQTTISSGSKPTKCFGLRRGVRSRSTTSWKLTRISYRRRARSAGASCSRSTTRSRAASSSSLWWAASTTHGNLHTRTANLQLVRRGWREPHPRQPQTLRPNARLCFAGQEVAGKPIHDDIDRTHPDGRTSAVHFLRFSLSPEQASSFKQAESVVLKMANAQYPHMTELSKGLVASIAQHL
mmetsp:Transcript_52673/g.127579  ORF Transcript_52673/g.127579 Transcript_52673/m.127579 type:complete len:214 (-) Transcript_52673:282-923(-)